MSVGKGRAEGGRGEGRGSERHKRCEPKVPAGRGGKVADTGGPDFNHAANRSVSAEGRRSGGAMIKVEPSAQSLGFANRPVLATRSLVGEGDDIVEPLMIAFVLMVGWVLVERVAQGTL